MGEEKATKNIPKLEFLQSDSSYYSEIVQFKLDIKYIYGHDISAVYLFDDQDQLVLGAGDLSHLAYGFDLSQIKITDVNSIVQNGVSKEGIHKFQFNYSNIGDFLQQ
ncbi:MAG: hypothetical protein AAF696_37190, partial [Bacteroidota bacterium]